nr:MAG TPA: hypothetical protein [Caudoviricetes sp.]DAY19162.1 MAG TPA: hypothetical protein [Caudoviricetes sp.]
MQFFVCDNEIIRICINLLTFVFFSDILMII